MLVLTQNATAVISSLTDRPELPAGAGLRIAATGDGSEPLAVTTAATPDAADQIIEGQGARVFLDTDAAVRLDDKVLDAEVTERDGVQFLLAPQ